MEILIYLIIIVAVIFFFINKAKGKKESDTTDNQQSNGTPPKQVSQEEINKSSMDNKYWIDPPKAWWQKQSIEWYKTENPVQTLVNMAKNGDSWACYIIYNIFTDRKYSGGEFSHFYNPEKAFPFLKKAAELGHARAQVEIVEIAHENPNSEYGTITANEAKQWLFSAAESGYDRAMFVLGNCYNGGYDFLGIENDLVKAREYYQKAVDINGISYDDALEELQKLDVDVSLGDFKL